MRNHINPKNNQPSPLVAEDVFDIIIKVHILAQAGTPCQFAIQPALQGELARWRLV